VTHSPRPTLGRAGRPRLWSVVLVLAALLAVSAGRGPMPSARHSGAVWPSVGDEAVARGAELGLPSARARAEGEVMAPRFPARPSRQDSARRPSRPFPRARATGVLAVVGGTAPEVGSGPLVTFAVEVERGIPLDRATFAATVQRILYDSRGWTAGGQLTLRRVGSAPDFRVALATPATTDRLCAPLETSGRFSCHQEGRAVLNLWRWRRGARSYGDDLRGYRTYLVNHEVGHALGLSWHPACPRSGAPAPVMMQQTLGVGDCRPHPWPQPVERAALH
jgi:hypothetical protein